MSVIGGIVLKIRSRLGKVFAYVLLFAMLANSLGMVVSADNSKKGSIKVKYLEEYQISNAHFKLYRVADFENRDFTAVGDFAKYNTSISWEIEDNEDWKNLASTIKAYIVKDGIKADKSASTNEKYECDFTNLEKGLYLLEADNIKEGRTTYKSEPFFVILPYTKDGKLEYDVTVKPKVKTTTTSPGGGGGGGGGGDNPLKRKVLKVWENDNENDRPEYIEVELLRDGEVYDSIRLNERNNWRMTWTDLSEDYYWTVVEKEVPKDYTVKISKEGITFVITNTKKDNPPGDNPPGDNPPPSGDDPPEKFDNEDPPRGKTENPPIDDPLPEPTEEFEEEIPLAPRLPQTGVLWWPAPVLFASGLILLIIGLKKRAR